MNAPRTDEPEPSILDIPCPFCACLCDDLRARVGAGSIEVAGGCAFAQQAFQHAVDHADDPSCLVHGVLAPVEAGLEAGAEILRHARRLLVCGLEHVPTHAQRGAIAIAERLGGVVDTAASLVPGPTLCSFPDAGLSTCTLGEIRDRSDLLVFWGGDPASTHPRLLERLASETNAKTIVLVGSGESALDQEAALSLPRKPGSDFDALWGLRALLRGIDIDLAALERQTGVPGPRWRELAERMSSSHYGAVLVGGFEPSAATHLCYDALYALVRELNEQCRFVAFPLSAHANEAGAGQVLCWQTGYPFSVDFARGYPRSNPGEYSASRLLEREEVDAALVFTGPGGDRLSAAARAQLERLPRVELACPASESPSSAEVLFRVAMPGVQTSGTFYRLDEVPLTLRKLAASSLPDAADVLGGLDDRLASHVS